MAKHTRKPVRAKSPRGGATVGKAGKPMNKMPHAGGAGAHQGGAPRGAARLEPATLSKGTGRISGKRDTQKGRGRVPRDTPKP